MAKVQIRVYNDFTNTSSVKIEVQEVVGGYNKVFSEEVDRENIDSVVSELKTKYPNYEMCEFLI